MPASPRTALVARAALVVSIALGASVLTACSGDTAPPESTDPAMSETPTTPADDNSSSSGSNDADDSDSDGDASAPTEPGTPDDEPDATATLSQLLAEAMQSGNTGTLEDVLSDPVRVVIAASEADNEKSPVDAILDLDYISPGVGTWDFSLAPDLLERYASNDFYGSYFPVDAVVGRSDESAVVSFIPDGDTIGTIFMSISDEIILL